jgi:hypothetical protein
LKLYANNISDLYLVEIKKLLENYFTKKLDLAFDEFYESNQLTPEHLKNWAFEHNRAAN